SAVRGRAVLEYRDDLSPELTSERLLRLGREVDAIAVVAADHPKITQAIERLAAEGVPVVALISDLTAPSRAASVGLDNWKVGGGITGVMRALREEGGEAAKSLVVVGRELTPETRAGLIDGVVKMILAHPIRLLADTTRDALVEATTGHTRSEVMQRVLPFEI